MKARTVLAGCAAALLVGIVGTGSCGYLVFRSIRTSEPYRMAVDEVRRSPAAREALGEPIEQGLLTSGTIGVTGADGEAKLAIPVSGPKGEGTLHVEAVKKAGAWTMTLLRLDPPDGDPIDLLPGADLAVLERGCGAGRAADCNTLGVRLSMGKEGMRSSAGENASAVAHWYGKACDLGHSDGCSNLGVAYEYGWGVGKDLSRAIELYERQCSAGNPRACTNLGSLYTGTTGAAPDFPRAAPLLERGCEAGIAFACSNLGVLHQRGTGVGKDLARAADLYGKACDGGHALGCVNLAELHVRGWGVRQDSERAAELFRRACNAKDDLGCKRLGEVAGGK